MPVCEGIDWESDELEEAATKIQVKTNHNSLLLSKAGFFGWKARRALAELEEGGEEEDKEGGDKNGEE